MEDVPLLDPHRLDFPIVVKPAKTVGEHNGQRQRFSVRYARDANELTRIVRASEPAAFPLLLQLGSPMVRRWQPAAVTASLSSGRGDVSSKHEPDGPTQPVFPLPPDSLLHFSDLFPLSFAPADHPKVAVAVVVENGGFGGRSAAPIAKALMQAILGKS